MIAFMIHGAFLSFLCFDIFRDEEVSQLVEAVANLFDLCVAKIPFAEVSSAFLDREHGNPLARYMRRIPSAQDLSAALGSYCLCALSPRAPVGGFGGFKGDRKRILFRSQR